MIRDEEFYDSLIRPIEETMMACIWKVTQNRENAQDAMQEALATIWRKRERIAAHPNPEARMPAKPCAGNWRRPGANGAHMRMRRARSSPRIPGCLGSRRPPACWSSR